jgi:hypothetical protein
MAKTRQSYEERRIHWGEKVSREAGVSFAPRVGHWAVDLLDKLDSRSGATAEAPGMASLAAAVGVTRKFLSGVLAVTNGLISFDAGPPVRIVLHRKRLLGAKRAAEKTRGRISASLRAQLYQKDGHQCGRCDKKLPSEELVIDHLIPLALRGADEPVNWVALCRDDNRRSGTASATASFATTAASQWPAPSASASAADISGLTSIAVPASTADPTGPRAPSDGHLMGQGDTVGRSFPPTFGRKPHPLTSRSRQYEQPGDVSEKRQVICDAGERHGD